MVSVDELKSLPAVKKVNWEIFSKHFCAMPEANKISLNVNTLDFEDIYLLSSIFPNLPIKDAEYIIENIPLSGFDDINSFMKSFPNINFNDPNGELKFLSNIFEINTEIIFNEFTSSSSSKIIYENNNNGFIISRIYNGI